MKKLLFAILIVFASVCEAYSATWYACAGSANMSGIQWHSLTGCSGGSDLTWASRSAGDIFLANAQTGIVVDVDPGVSGSKVVLNTATNGGGFVITTGTITVTADIGVVGHTGTTDVLTVSGGTVTILGDIYGGGTANADGLVISGSSTTVTIGSATVVPTIIGGSATATAAINTSHTVTTLTIGASGHPATIQGGTSSSGYGIWHNGTGTGVYYANITGGGGVGLAVNAAGTVTVYGNCTGSSSASGGVGCQGGQAASVLNVTGNLIWGTATSGAGAAPASGNLRWKPGPGNYVLVPASATYASGTINAQAVMAGPVADGSSYSTGLTTEADIATGKYIGTALGTASSGGGGAWAF